VLSLRAARTMAAFAMPPVSDSGDLWGPPTLELNEMEAGICDFAEHLEKFPIGRIGRICDFSASGQRYLAERQAKGKGKKGKPIITATTEKDEEGFVCVDKMPAPSKGRGRGSFGRNKGKGRGVMVNYQEGILGQRPRQLPRSQQMKGKGKGKGGPMRRNLPSFRDWSVQTRTEWEMKREIMLNTLAKLQLDAKEVTMEDQLWCGKLHTYNRGFDRLTTKTERPLRRFEDLQFFFVSASDDPHLQDMLQEDKQICMIATDQVLACIIAAARSVYSWDVIVTKVQNKLIFDKRDGSQVDAVSVNETANEPPNNEDKENINSPVKLGQEAGCINQNFTQMVLDFDSPPQEMAEPNPFEDEDDEFKAASGAYRYRKITLPGDPKADNEFEREPCSMIVRTEVSCRLPDSNGSKGGFLSVKALNEFDPKLNYSWRTHLESQRGACLATELKNNAFKLGRWTAQAILAGCDTMKIGYVSRVQPTDPHTHSVLGVQTYHTDNFADQIGLTRNNAFGILRTIINTIMQWEDGKYLLLKDPMKTVMRIYELPWEAFKSDDEDGDGDEDDDDDQELDEDGNVAPPQPSLVR